MKWSYCLGNPPYQSETVGRLSEQMGRPLGKMSFIISRWKLTKSQRMGLFLYIPAVAGFISLGRDCSNSVGNKSTTQHYQRLSFTLMLMKCSDKQQTFLTGLRLY